VVDGVPAAESGGRLIRLHDNLFPNTCGFTAKLAHVIELGAANGATALDRDFSDHRAVGGENTLHAFAMRDFADREGGIRATIAFGYDDPFKRLKALAVAFLNPYLYDHGVARREFWDLFLKQLGFKFLDDIGHGRSAPAGIQKSRA